MPFVCAVFGDDVDDASGVRGVLSAVVGVDNAKFLDGLLRRSAALMPEAVEMSSAPSTAMKLKGCSGQRKNLGYGLNDYVRAA